MSALSSTGSTFRGSVYGGRYSQRETGEGAQEANIQMAKHGFGHSVKLWWYGGESKRQRLRKTTSVYRRDEGFDEPDNPQYHWTAFVLRWLVGIVRRHTAEVIIGLIVSVTGLCIYETWFN